MVPVMARTFGTPQYSVRMKRTTSRKLFHMLPCLQDPYKIQKYTFLLDFGSRGFGKNIYIFPPIGGPLYILIRVTTRHTWTVAGCKSSAMTSTQSMQHRFKMGRLSGKMNIYKMGPPKGG